MVHHKYQVSKVNIGCSAEAKNCKGGRDGGGGGGGEGEGRWVRGAVMKSVSGDSFL